MAAFVFAEFKKVKHETYLLQMLAKTIEYFICFARRNIFSKDHRISFSNTNCYVCHIHDNCSVQNEPHQKISRHEYLSCFARWYTYLAKTIALLLKHCYRYCTTMAQLTSVQKLPNCILNMFCKMEHYI